MARVQVYFTDFKRWQVDVDTREVCLLGVVRAGMMTAWGCGIECQHGLHIVMGDFDVSAGEYTRAMRRKSSVSPHEYTCDVRKESSSELSICAER